MTNIFQTGSRLALIAMLAGAPVAGMAQTATTETDAEVTADTETATDEMKDAAEKAGDAVEGAAEDAAAATEEAAGDAAAATEEAVDDAAAATEEAVDDAAAGTEAAVDGMAAEPAAEEEVAQPVEGQITLQSENTILANDLIGSAVYSSNGDSIGEIDDMIVNLDGNVEGVVIGVGGFLGIGEKDVAIAMDSLSTTTDENGNIRLVTSATEADLEAAEAFVTKAAQDQANRAMESMPAGDGTAPAAPAANN
ncbi:PRC-barrel domain-containing protein [Oceaniglobus trochenteri]|uniref:PRC-barrel domain-containing protein n=1 Tax=Oceaniglobus trochenteri TaxID=2763260 RepID=UPI001CFF7176|nr:PRC-barrel domain-containing protein [Oceaniglobus trochenteri]